MWKAYCYMERYSNKKKYIYTNLVNFEHVDVVDDASAAIK